MSIGFAYAPALRAATGVKPDRRMLDVVLAQHDLKATELAMVGDRLYTDIAMARATGAVGVLVLTGEATTADVAVAEVKPDIIVKNLAELGKLLTRAGNSETRINAPHSNES